MKTKSEFIKDLSDIHWLGLDLVETVISINFKRGISDDWLVVELETDGSYWASAIQQELFKLGYAVNKDDSGSYSVIKTCVENSGTSARMQ